MINNFPLRTRDICGALLFCLLSCAGLFWARSSFGAEALPTDKGAPPLLRVKVTAVRHTILSSQLSGHIASLAVRDGECFTQGQTLVSLECSAPKAQLRRAEAAVQKHKAVYSTTQKLEQLNSRSQLDLAVARAEADQAAAEAAAARIMVDRCTISAPFSGRVAERMAQENQFVQEGQPLLEILDPSELELEFIAPSHWLPWFIQGFAFSVRIDETQHTYQARLTRLSGKVDAVSQSIKGYARLVEQDSQLLPGMSGEARIVPAAAQQ